MASVPLLITGHEQTQKTRFAIFISLMWSLLPKDLAINLFIFTAAGFVLCGTRKTSPVHHYSADYIFWSCGIIELSFKHLKIEFRFSQC